MDILTLGAGAIAGYVVANQKPSQNTNKKGASILVLSCIDPRFADNLAWFLIHESKLKDDYDLLCLAGASLGTSTSSMNARSTRRQTRNHGRCWRRGREALRDMRRVDLAQVGAVYRVPAVARYGVFA